MYLQPMTADRHGQMQYICYNEGYMQASRHLEMVTTNQSSSWESDFILAKLAHVSICGLPSSERQLEQCFFRTHCTHQRSCFERTLRHMPTCCCLCSAIQPVGSDTKSVESNTVQFWQRIMSRMQSLIGVTDSFWKALNEKLRSCIKSQHHARRSSVLSWFDLVEHDHTYPA